MPVIEQARALGLAQQKEWRALLHYRPRGVVESFVDDNAFFLAPNGKTDPQAELEATLRAVDNDGVQCRFIARYRWLRQQLAINDAPPPRCAEYETWRAQFGNQPAVTLIFASSFLGNPASIFGHTLLRIDNRAQTSALLGYTVNYAAVTQDPMSFKYAFNGVFGGYNGRFTGAPYHRKLTEYADLENRDMWEYSLDLSAEETERLLEHLWELRPIYFDYFFFDENCSYHLLALLEVARPASVLTEKFPYWVIPAETIRAVNDAGLVARKTFRPSRATQLRADQQQLNANEIELARTLAEGDITSADEHLQSLPPARQAKVLDVAVEYADYRRLAGKRRRSEAPYALDTHLDDLLATRSHLDVSTPALSFAPNSAPENSHRPARIAFGMGRSDSQVIEEIRLRPGYHDVLDPDVDDDMGRKITLFDVHARHSANDGLRLERFTIVDIVSLPPRDALLQPFSWHVNVGESRQAITPNNRPLIFDIGGGVGGSFTPISAVLLYGLVDTAVDVSHELQDSYAIGVGPHLGLIFLPMESWKVQFDARTLRFSLGHEHENGELLLAQRWALSRQNALQWELGRRREFGRGYPFSALFWNVYF